MNRSAILNCIGLLLFAAVILTGLWFHEPWRDELQAWIIARDLNVSGIIYQMRFEGHFALWSLLLHPFAASGAPLFCLGLLSGGLMFLAAGLFLFRSPFAGYAKVAFLLSFPMIYYFPVVSRCYAMIPPLLFGMAVLYRTLPRHRLLYCFLMGLLAHTHVYMEGMVAALFLIYCYDCILRPWKGLSLREKVSSVGGALLTLGMVGLAFLQVFPSMDLRKDLEKFTYSLQKTLGTMEETLMPPDVAGWVRVVEYLVLILLIGWFFSRCIRGYNLRIPLIVIGAVAWQIFFSIEIYPMMFQRAYLFLFILVFAMWIMARQRTLLSITVTFLSLLTMHRLPEVYEDLKRPYSNSARVMEWVDAYVPYGGIVAVDNLTKVVTSYRPDYQLISICNLKPVVTYAPHTPCKERLEEFSTKVMDGETFYYIRSNIGLKNFGKTIRKLEDRYEIELLNPPDMPRSIMESFYLYRIRKKNEEGIYKNTPI